MRVACLTHYYIEENRAGGELMLHALLSALAAAGHEVTAYITDTKKRDTIIDGVKVVYNIYPEIIDTVECDVLLSQFQNAPYAMEVSKRRQIPFVYVVHNDHWFTMRLLRFMNARDLALFNTEWIKQQYMVSCRPIVVHPPIDRKAFKTKTTGEYVTLVNLTKAKGFDVFAALAKAFPDQKFLGVKGGYYKNNQQTIDLPNVTIIENTPNMRQDVYAKSKVVLMPSDYETFGMVAAEAIASGIPVIASPTAGLMENLGDAGVYARRGSHEVRDWTAALDRLLNDPAYYKQVSKLCVARSKVINSAAEIKAFVAAVEGLVNA